MLYSRQAKGKSMQTTQSNLMKNPMHRRRAFTPDKMTFNIISFLVITAAGIICLLPFLLILSGSVTEETSIFNDGYRLIPKVFSLHAYDIFVKSPETMLRAYLVTIVLTATGAAVGLFLTTMTAYVLLRKDFPWRNGFAFYFFFTTLFSGGLVPWYILMVKYLQMKNNPLSMLISSLFSVFNILLMRNYMKSVPDSVLESARIDGAGDFRVFIRIVLPLCGPALATIGLFIALGYWNQWFDAMLFMDDEAFFPLQYYLYRILNSMQFAATVAKNAHVPMPKMPNESFKLAMTVVTTGPIIFLYPFVQKYFIRGITIGAVKG
jgi:putative aldouronate transport system permease protein